MNVLMCLLKHASTQVQLITPQNTPTSTMRQVCEVTIVGGEVECL